LRFVVDRPVPGGNRRRRVDILLRGARVAVFVDGCFWHSCPEHRPDFRRKLGVVTAFVAAEVADVDGEKRPVGRQATRA
jgi:DNA mismatch endonuclease Vsr